LHERVARDGAPAAAAPQSPVAAAALFQEPRAVSAEAGEEVPPFDEALAVEAGCLSYGDTLAARLDRLEALISPETEFQHDRVRVTDTEAYPYCCICHLRSTFPTPQSKFLFALGTGWVIGKRTLITAGHCVYVFSDRKFGLSRVWAARVEVIPGRNGEAKPFGSFAVKTGSLRTTKGWRDQGAEAADYAAIILDEDLPTNFGRFGFGAHTDLELTGLSATIAGYPGELKKLPLAGTMWGDSTPPLLSPERLRLRHRIDTTRGQSGSPVFYVRPSQGDAVAVGIHNYGVQRDNVNRATRVTAQVKENLRAWRDEGGGVWTAE
jgi:V8-like Glu-specific endopeptidase